LRLRQWLSWLIGESSGGSVSWLLAGPKDEIGCWWIFSEMKWSAVNIKGTLQTRRPNLWFLFVCAISRGPSVGELGFRTDMNSGIFKFDFGYVELKLTSMSLNLNLNILVKEI
jgi:hypothetical protein